MTLSLATQLEHYIDGLGLRHFRGCELTPLWRGVHEGIRNNPPPPTRWSNIVVTLRVLDAFREAHGAPVTIISAYRSPAYNAAVGGAPNSQHLAFRALDFTSPVGTPEAWAARLRRMRGRSFPDANGRAVRFIGGIGVYPTRNFVHVDSRMQVADWVG